MVIDLDAMGTVFGVIISVSTVLGIFTKIVNNLFSQKLKPLEDKIDKNERTTLENDMDEWRFQCVSFASDLHNDIPKTIYEYQILFKIADKYEQAVETLDIKNGLFEEEMIFIRASYQELLKNNKRKE
jgi:hypothetical protein